VLAELVEIAAAIRYSASTAWRDESFPVAEPKDFHAVDMPLNHEGVRTSANTSVDTSKQLK
jgi:hypothetical protein